MKPVYAIADKRFAYRNAACTDIAATRREWMERYTRAWNSAHQENAEREAGNVQQLRRAK